MALNIKIEPSQGTSSIVDLLSDTEVTPEVPGMKSPERPARSGTPPDIHCSICLDEYNNKCHPDICWHKFCFECLKRWSYIESSCPLCKKTFKQIHHSLVDEISTAVYEVPLMEDAQQGIEEYDQQQRIFLRPFAQLSQSLEATTYRSINLDLYVDLFTRNGSRNNGNAQNFESNALHIRDNNFNIGLPEVRIGFRSPRLIPVDRLYASSENALQMNARSIRVRVYQENLWAEPLPDLSGRYRDCSSNFYRENPSQTFRLHGFILRDITILRNLPQVFLRVGSRIRSNISTEVLTNMIMRSILICEIRDMQMITMLTPYFLGYAEHFLHELYNFANSPYDMIGYDRNVRYNSIHQHRLISPTDYVLNDVDLIDLEFRDDGDFHVFEDPIDEPIIVNSDDDDPIVSHTTLSSTTRGPVEVIEINSSGESDVEILNIIETPSDTFSRDQPSTSTGIRDSFIRPNPRYNLRRRRLFQHNQPNCSSFTPSNGSQMNTIERIILDTSSEDEAIETNTRGTQTLRVKSREVLFGKRKRKKKRSKLKKSKKNVVESRPEVRFGFRPRSSSESSSSGDTDTNSSSNIMNMIL